MGKWLSILASALWLVGTAAEAQQSPLPGELVPTRRLNLTMEDRHVIRELIKDLRLVPAATSAKAVGDAVAPDFLFAANSNSEIRSLYQLHGTSAQPVFPQGTLFVHLSPQSCVGLMQRNDLHSTPSD